MNSIAMARVAPEKAVFRPALPKRSLPGSNGTNVTRKAIAKKTRFEVFKRDGFKCMYCGAEAPRVVLHVDHIKPVAGGGGNELLNLITSCFDCNNGKGSREISDNSAVAKQRTQMVELQERREQLEMMLKWRDGLAELTDDQKQIIRDHFRKQCPGFSIRDESKLPTEWLRKYSLAKVLDAIDLAVHRYLKTEDGKPTSASVEEVLQRTGGILRVGDMEPDEKRLHYIKGIVRNRMYLPNYLMADLKRAAKAGVSLDDIEEEAKTARNWTEFNLWLQAATDEAEDI